MHNVILVQSWVLFLKDEHGNIVAVNFLHYSDMLVHFSLPEIDKYDPGEETLFQHDGETSHTTAVQ